MKIQIADSELPIMKVLWKESPLTSAEILSKMEGNTNTLKTLLQRLVAKGALETEAIDKRSYSYRPVISQKEYRKICSKGFLEKVFDGSTQAMLLNFVKEEQVTKEELEELLRQIEEE